MFMERLFLSGEEQKEGNPGVYILQNTMARAGEMVLGKNNEN